MDIQDAIDLGREAIMVSLWVSAPMLAAGMLVGLIIGLLQALTQIQEQTVAFVPKLVAMVLAFALTGLLYAVMRASKAGRAIVAVRMDRDAAALMGIRIPRIYAMTFGIGAGMAGACGVLFAVAFPVTTNVSGLLLGKAFVVCVIGGLGSVPGALLGGLALGMIESFSGHWFGPQNAITIGFVLMLVLLMVRPTGLLGIKGYE